MNSYDLNNGIQSIGYYSRQLSSSMGDASTAIMGLINFYACFMILSAILKISDNNKNGISWGVKNLFQMMFGIVILLFRAGPARNLVGVI